MPELAVPGLAVPELAALVATAARRALGELAVAVRAATVERLRTPAQAAQSREMAVKGAGHRPITQLSSAHRSAQKRSPLRRTA